MEELIAAGPDADPLPPGTRDILLSRVRRLTEEEQAVLRAVAVAGRRAGHELLADVMAAADDGEELLERLRIAVQEQILVTDADGYAFRHALVAEALLAETLPGERRRLHRGYAQALSRRRIDHPGPTTPAEPPRRPRSPTTDARRRSGARARRHDRGRARRRAALRAGGGAPALRPRDPAVARDRAGPADRRARPGELCRHGAEAAFLAGDTEHAIALVRQGIEAEPPERAGDLYERLGRYLWANADAESESIGAYERAVELTPDAPTEQRATVLNGLASALLYADRPDPSAWYQEALRVARAAGARGDEGRALQTPGYCSAMAGDVEAGLGHCRQALAIAAELGQSEDHCRAYVQPRRRAADGRADRRGRATAMEGVDAGPPARGRPHVRQSAARGRGRGADPGGSLGRGGRAAPGRSPTSPPTGPR